MTPIANTSSTTSTTSSTAKTSDKKANDQLNQADFLRLLTTQLKNQDPTNPLDGQQFMAQMAQFSTLNAIMDMKTSLDALVESLKPKSTAANSTAAATANNSAATATV